MDHYHSHLTFSQRAFNMGIERLLNVPKRYPVSSDNVSQLVLPWKDHFVLRMAVLWIFALISGTLSLTLFTAKFKMTTATDRELKGLFI